MKRRVNRLWKILKQYLSNCSIHGVRYLVDSNLSWIERIFWLVSCVICWWGCIYIVNHVITEYLYNPGVLSSGDTTYTDWQIPVPSVSFCIKSSTQIQNKYFKKPPSTLESNPVTKDEKISAKELLDAYEQMKIPCNKLLERCVWNDVEFDCCKQFKPLFKTGSGYCLTMNSLTTGQGRAPRLNFFVNRTVKYSDLLIDIRDDITDLFLREFLDVYVLNNYEVPIVAQKIQKTLQKNVTTRIDFTMSNIHNEDSMKSISVQQRKCRFEDEVGDIKLHYMYSEDICIVELYVWRMLKICGCVHFYYPTPPGARTCNMIESECIYNNKEEIKSAVIQKSTCIPNCEGTSIVLNDVKFSKQSKSNTTRFHLKMLTRPILMFQRYVIFDIIDLVVSVGSAVSLFTGASILSLFEIPYWLFARRDNIS